MTEDLKHLKERCADCNRQGVPMNKEHIFPKWLILRTRTNQSGIRWGGKHDVPALACTFPLCEDCNTAFGKELEGPVSMLFEEIEQGRGITDFEAELLIRWMWKIEGLAWIANHPDVLYSEKYTLRERVLFPIDDIRGRLILGVALIKELHPESDDFPMGVDSTNEYSVVFVSGVFSRVATMTVLDEFETMIPSQFGRYRLAPVRQQLQGGKLFYPPTSFKDDVEAVGVTKIASDRISVSHDRMAISLQKAKEKEDNES
ncbi:hypothetical protein [Candidatus Nitronereus thalassa]|uniref:HNH endonuclease n=1 Tax=Candidatus Nitronereus thalassa TaxID=3020898 RepID=A0ABU3K7N6_9BACT|nr:hypothetical protein [Candidatus Nitronereus thalassa]MDT7042405.1 hypothetical protein [Candidatus Nitronereus thalassa]